MVAAYIGFGFILFTVGFTGAYFIALFRASTSIVT